MRGRYLVDPTGIAALVGMPLIVALETSLRLALDALEVFHSLASGVIDLRFEGAALINTAD